MFVVSVICLFLEGEGNYGRMGVKLFFSVFIIIFCLFLKLRISLFYCFIRN